MLLVMVIILFTKIFSMWSYQKNFGIRQKCLDLKKIIARFLLEKRFHLLFVTGQRDAYAKI